MKKFDVIIVGGGLVGYAFALDLARKNQKLNLALIELKEPLFDNKECLDSRVYAIAPDNIKYLQGLGVEINELRHGKINVMDVSGDLNSNIILDKNTTQNQFLAKTFEYKILQQDLYKKICELDNITLIYDSVVGLESGINDIRIIGEKSMYVTNLIVGADGANSSIRRMSNIKFSLVDYKQSGVVANFSCEIPHKNVAYQWFKVEEILAYLPLAENNISIVLASDKKDQFLTMKDDDFADLISEFGHYKLGRLKLLTKPMAFPLKMYLLEKVYSDRVVLIGDAAHTIHPLAGQGVNLGFRDARSLAATLAKLEAYQLGEIGLLARYNASRQLRVKQMQLVCHGLHRLFASESEIVKNIRNTGLNIVNKLPIIKNIFSGAAS